MNVSFLETLRSERVLVADGATGTNFQARGLPAGTPADQWVLERPDEVLRLHRDFVEAGADIILTCSFGSNRLCHQGPGEQTDEKKTYKRNHRAAELARHAADESDRRVFVAGSMGPTGQMLQPYGPLTPREVETAYGEQAAALDDGGVDVLLLETFFAIEEALAAIRGVQGASHLPLICSFSYDRDAHTMMGVSPIDMAQAIGSTGVVAIGANCGTTLRNMERVIRELARVRLLPLWAKPNAGLPEGSPPRYPVGPKKMADFANRFIEAGARVVGGCCGSTPAHIKAIATSLEQMRVSA